jgi:hypothetical protein
MDMRVCTGCKEEKPLDADHFEPIGKGATARLNTRCRTCVLKRKNAYNAKVRAADPDKWRAARNAEAKAARASRTPEEAAAARAKQAEYARRSRERKRAELEALRRRAEGAE